MNALDSSHARASQQGLTLLVADALRFTPIEDLTKESMSLMSAALKRALHSDCSIEDESKFIGSFCRAGLTITAPFRTDAE